VVLGPTQTARPSGGMLTDASDWLQAGVSRTGSSALEGVVEVLSGPVGAKLP